MNNANSVGALRRQLRWVILASVASAAFACALPAKNFFEKEVAPFGVNVTSLDGQNQVDPRQPIVLDAVGMGTKISKVELIDSTGKVIAEASNQTHVSFDQPLAFGTQYTLKITSERDWAKQTESRELKFSTVAVPKLEGATKRMVGPDSTVALRFDQPVGEIQVKSDLKLDAKLSEDHKEVRLVASDYGLDKTYPVELGLKSTNGIELPPVAMELFTAPPMTVESNMKGQSNLGTALPLILNFSEALGDRAEAEKNIQVVTDDGKAVEGRWEHQGQKTLRFIPKSGWPASSTIHVKAEPVSVLSVRGGGLNKPMDFSFTTGTDRHLYVYLDTQTLLVVENGQVVKTFKVSTGKPKTPTVQGNFYIYDRYRHKTMRSDVPKGQKGYYEVEDVPYTQFFHRDYAFHGAFWHNAFGHTASHGCVNMSTKDHNSRWPHASEDAGWLYQWASLGVPVTVTAKPNGEFPTATAKSENKEPVVELNKDITAEPSNTSATSSQ